jgi:hypothetical protein
MWQQNWRGLHAQADHEERLRAARAARHLAVLRPRVPLRRRLGRALVRLGAALEADASPPITIGAMLRRETR